MSMLMKPWVLENFMRFWPPFWGSSIRVEYVARDHKEIVVAMPVTWYNKNYVGTHFGGNLFAMTDPFYMLMLMEILGRGYYVWDKAASIEFIKPGKSKVTARFQVTDAMLEEILQNTANGEKFFKVIDTEIKDADGELIAKVSRTLYIRKKKPKS